MKNKKIRTEESLEKFKTDLSEYAFILEQQYKKNKTDKIKDVLVKKILIG